MDLDPGVLTDLHRRPGAAGRPADRARQRPGRDQGRARAGARRDAPRSGPGRASRDNRSPRAPTGLPLRHTESMFYTHGIQTLDTRLGPLAWQSSGHGPALVFFAGALANHDLWRDVIAALRRPLPLHHGRPPAGRASLAAGPRRRPVGHLAGPAAARLPRPARGGRRHGGRQRHGGRAAAAVAGHRPPALERVGRLVLTNCESYDQFPPDALKNGVGAVPRVPRARPGRAPAPAGWPAAMRRTRPPSPRTGSTATGRSRSSAGHGATAGSPATWSRPWPASARSCSSTPPRRSREFDQPVLLIWGDACRFFPMTHAQRLASDFPHATLVPVPGAKTWVPVDNPAAVADAIANFVPTPVP